MKSNKKTVLRLLGIWGVLFGALLSNIVNGGAVLSFMLIIGGIILVMLTID